VKKLPAAQEAKKFLFETMSKGGLKS